MLAQNAGSESHLSRQELVSCYLWTCIYVPVGRQTGNYHWCANETCLKTDLNPSALFHQTNLTLPPLDRQSPEVLDQVLKPVMSALIALGGFSDEGCAIPRPGLSMSVSVRAPTIK
jgi:hypothetical protein